MEFTPASSGRGSFLNVAAMWLWCEKDYLSFDYKSSPGYDSQPNDFIAFENEEQFTPLAEKLALRAADEVRHYRSLFPSVHSAAQHLAAKSPMGFWDAFHAGVACGLAGDAVQANHFFAKVAETKEQRDWIQVAVALAQEHCRALEDLAGFRHRIEASIRRARSQLQFPEIDDIALK
ncbi:hypothetical protein [Gemmata sp. SH-PL17]|uniref:hypothetical protein n=1 Tax=Gemmata sp. SH-PL17 TaxID=1630693 RepID=UPI0012FBB1BE|nr:hypothetical protein [Gemmata sp. SH-PL17]